MLTYIHVSCGLWHFRYRTLRVLVVKHQRTPNLNVVLLQQKYFFIPTHTVQTCNRYSGAASSQPCTFKPRLSPCFFAGLCASMVYLQSEEIFSSKIPTPSWVKEWFCQIRNCWVWVNVNYDYTELSVSKKNIHLLNQYLQAPLTVNYPHSLKLEKDMKLLQNWHIDHP